MQILGSGMFLAGEELNDRGSSKRKNEKRGHTF